MARVSRGKFQWLRGQYRQIMQALLFKRNIERQWSLDSICAQPGPAVLETAFVEMGQRNGLTWDPAEFVVRPEKLTGQQIKAFNMPVEQAKALPTANTKLNELLARPVRWS